MGDDLISPALAGLAAAVARGVGGPLAEVAPDIALDASGPLADWGETARLLSRHRIQALAAPALLHRQDAALPEDLRRNLVRAVMLAVRIQSTQLAVLERMMAALEAAGLRAMSIKGPMVGRRFMARPELRLSNDLDILVDPARLDDAEAVIAANGYYRIRPAPDLSPARLAYHRRWRKDAAFLAHDRGQGPMIECHWRIFDNPRLLPLDFEALWAARRMDSLNGAAIPVIGDVQQLVYLAMHGANHGWFRLKWVADFAAVAAAAPLADRLAAAELARRLGVLPVLNHALSLAVRFFSIPLDPSETARIAADRRVPSLDGFALDALAHPDASVIGLAHDRAFALRMTLHSHRLRTGPGYRVSQLISQLNDPTLMDRSTLPDGLLWMHPALRGLSYARHQIGRRIGWRR
ncbi:nucleotidyltransferase family protein [Tistrella sp. BH-R2-4]|uniref:Nucleotidyltransferase family protein n=1 Tax=Tistrella arctica TaxID=3133430 RepID=A0ABU9YPB2_9PROT